MSGPAVLKLIGIIAFVFFGIIKFTNFNGDARNTSKSKKISDDVNRTLRGVVTKVLPEDEGFLVNVVDESGKSFWVLTGRKELEPGQELEMVKFRNLEAYESKLNQMAFEKVWQELT